MKHETFPDVAHLVEPGRDRQWIFDQVVEHYRRQPKQCVSADRCVYRGTGTLMCWGGALIADHDYEPDMEGKDIHEIAYDYPLPMWFKENAAFIRDIQKIHDTNTNWKLGRMPMVLRLFAAEHKLKISL